MAVSKAQQKAVHKYVKSNYDRMELTVPKGKKDDIRAAATAVGESMNQYIIAAVEQRMERDRDKGPSEAAEAHMMEEGTLTLAGYCQRGSEGRRGHQRGQSRIWQGADSSS